MPISDPARQVRFGIKKVRFMVKKVARNEPNEGGTTFYPSSLSFKAV